MFPFQVRLEMAIHLHIDEAIPRSANTKAELSHSNESPVGERRAEGLLS